MMNNFSTYLSAILALATIPFSATAGSHSKPQHTGITMHQARAIALKAAPGKVEKQELEKEDGSLRYSFDIRQGDKIHEIGVDATSGHIVEDKFEAANARD